MARTAGQSYWDTLAARNAGDTSILVAQFRSFYEEVVDLKAEAASQSYATDDEAEQHASQMQHQLLQLFETHEQHVRNVGGAQLRDRYRRVRYLMTALADEIFLEFDWFGRDYWVDHLLEIKLYDSQNAGERVFTFIDDLLEGRETQQLDLAKVYLFALVLGFEGKYRDADASDVLDDYKRKLYRFIERAKPGQMDADVPFVKEPYRHTLDRGEGQLLPNLRWWATSLGLTFVAYLVLSTFLWWYFTHDMVTVAQEILSI